MSLGKNTPSPVKNSNSSPKQQVRNAAQNEEQS